MKSPFSILNNEKGFVLIFVMLILLVLVLVGISGTTTTTIELQISGNDKFHKTAFYNADAGIYTTPKVISQALNADQNPPAVANITLFQNDAVTPSTTGDNWFYNEIMGFSAFQPAASGELTGTADLVLTTNNQQTGVDIVHAGTQQLAGGGAEFASGSSGVGSGSTGGIAINYDLTSVGTGPDNATSSLSARYRKVPGTAGGL